MCMVSPGFYAHQQRLWPSQFRATAITTSVDRLQHDHERLSAPRHHTLALELDGLQGRTVGATLLGAESAKTAMVARTSWKAAAGRKHCCQQKSC